MNAFQTNQQESNFLPSHSSLTSYKNNKWVLKAKVMCAKNMQSFDLDISNTATGKVLYIKVPMHLSVL